MKNWRRTDGLAEDEGAGGWIDGRRGGKMSVCTCIHTWMDGSVDECMGAWAGRLDRFDSLPCAIVARFSD